jgi:hypothetical protein
LVRVRVGAHFAPTRILKEKAHEKQSNDHYAHYFHRYSHAGLRAGACRDSTGGGRPYFFAAGLSSKTGMNNITADDRLI